MPLEAREPDLGGCQPVVVFKESHFKTLNSTGRRKSTKEFPFGQPSLTSGKIMEEIFHVRNWEFVKMIVRAPGRPRRLSIQLWVSAQVVISAP